MEHKIYTVEFEVGSEEEKNKTQVGTITSTDGIITATANDTDKNRNFYPQKVLQ